MKRHTIVRIMVLHAFLGMSVAAAADSFFVKPIAELEITSGTLPDNFENAPFRWSGRARWELTRAWGAVEGEGEVYLSGVHWNDNVGISDAADSGDSTPRIAVRAAAGQDVRGRLFVPQHGAETFTVVTFRLPAEAGKPEPPREYLQVKRAHYEYLMQSDIAGSAWFRHQIQATNKQLGANVDEMRARMNNRRLFGARRGNELADSFDLFSGGRALSENLQLDRVLPTTAPAEDRVPLGSIQGITVRAFDWKPLVQGLHPEPDPLARLIPHDQHALFFPSFPALVELIDRARERGTPVLRMGDPRAEDAGTYEFYQRQLCLPLGQFERLIGQQLIASIAVTGSDPYFRTGTDVAVLFEARNVQALRTALDARIALTETESARVTKLSGDILGVAYAGLRSTDREICCYVATLGSAVVVTNSPRQLERLIQTQQGGVRSLDSLDEYTFFRQRYPRSDASETALLVLSDDTIRRWCGPRWRIATSRRTRAVALMSELQAEFAEPLVRGTIRETKTRPAYWVPDVDELTVTAAGVRSPVHGTLGFQTPIIELEFDRVTMEEAEVYRRWQMQYQSYWRNFFDPIAVRFSLSPQELGVDLTVIPLIDASHYRWMISPGAMLKAEAADWHPSAMQWGLAINAETPWIKQAAGLTQMLAPQIQVNPLSWIGSAISVYADEDPVWAELAQVQTDAELQKFMTQNIHRVPVALHVNVASGVKLTAFLVGVRAFIEQTAPGMTIWETREHGGQAYVRISPSPQAIAETRELERVSVYYAPSGDSLIVTWSEDVLKRAIDRQVARRAAKQAGEQPPVAAGTPDLLGESVTFAANTQAVAVGSAFFGRQLEDVMQARAWGNIPILNEWKRRFPDQSPLVTHQKLWHRQLVCPGGGEYRWNEEWQTMESTVYGHPGRPKSGPGFPSELRDVAKANLGLTFEHNGLRAKAKLELKP